MRQFLCSGVAIVGLMAYSPTFSAVTECDRLASHPDDPDRNTVGVEHEDMNLAAAEAACRAAIAAYPHRAREHYHLGRALYYTGKIREAMKELEIASNAGYRQAIFVLGYVYSDGEVKRDDCRAGELFLRGVALEHPWSGAHLVEKAIAGRLDHCSFNLNSDDLERAMGLAEEHVTVTASGGRIEKLRASFNQYLNDKVSNISQSTEARQ